MSAYAGTPHPPIDIDGPVRVEIFVVALDGSDIVLTGPDGPRPWPAESHPPEHPLDTVRRLSETTMEGVRIVHSTSWRYEGGSVVLSFVVVVDDVDAMESVAVSRADLARSTSTAAPASIASTQVLEHGLRHLAWLACEDEAVTAALDGGWQTALDAYMPEPFRQLGG